MPDMISKDLGPVSGYAIAVAHGYTGTEEQWIQEVLRGTQNAQTATQKASEAAQSASTASQKATEASTSASTATQKANEAATSATAAAGSATAAAGSATTATQKATAASGSATAAANSASAAAADKTAVQNLANTFSNTTVPNAVAQVTAEGTAQVAAVEAKGQEVLDSIPSDYTALSAEVETLSETKADSNGNYSDLTAGSAEQLLSSDGVEDKVPYVFRQTGGGAEGVGTRLDEEIVGGTICWNQRCDLDDWTSGVGSGLTATAKDGKLTISGTSAGTTAFSIMPGSIYTKAKFTEGHKILVYWEGTHTFVRISYVVYGTNTRTYLNPGIKIAPANVADSEFVATPYGDGQPHDYSADITGYAVDLTQMFGAAVADQIYAMETASDGAGVAYFRSLFPNNYYAYNAGELMSVNAAKKETVGFNLWDEELEIGSIDTITGQNIVNSTTTRSKNYISIVPNTAYYTLLPWAHMFYYDADKNFISFQGNGVAEDGKVHGSLINTPSNAYFMRFRCTGIYGTTYKNDICINLSDPSRNGTYEPYQKHTYPLDSALTLRGIPKLDSANKLYYDGDIYNPDGSVKRRYGVVDLGSLNWNKSTSYNNPIFYAPIQTGISNNCICSKYPTYNIGVGMSAQTFSNNGTDLTIATSFAGTQIYIRDDAYETGTALKTALSGVYMVYELATPTSETAEPYQQIQVVDPLGTEEFVDAGVLAGTRDVAVPVGHNSLYMTDLRKKIEGIPGDFSTLLAPIETGYTASKAYAVNEFLIVGSQLYKVTASIANGATITPGTNVTATTVGAVLTALLNS